MNDEQIALLTSMIGQYKIVWRSPNNHFWEVSHIMNAPAFEGDEEPEPSAFFKDQKGHAALSNCEASDFYQMYPALNS
jgi:hypothetical protein